MNKLETFIVNPFFTIEVARPRVQKFVYNHIQRTKAISNPNFDQIILDTTVLWEALFGNIELYDETLNEQVSLTKMVDKVEKEFIAKAIQIEPHVVIAYEKGSSRYREFFPHGRTEYYDLTHSTAKVLMDRMVEKSHDHAAELGPDWETEFTDIRTQYESLYAMQQGKIGEVDHTSTDYEPKSRDMFIQLFKNCCLILAEYPELPEKMLDFFDQTIVNYVSHTKTVLVQKNSTEAFELNYAADDTIVITSHAAKTVFYYFAPDPDMPPPTLTNQLDPNAKVKVKGTDAGAPDNTYIIIINPSDTDAKIDLRIE